MVSTLERAREVAAAVPDPELPMLTLADLGVLAGVEEADGTVTAWLTPTYSGCPAVAEMAADVARRLRAAGFAQVEVRLRIDPPWSSDRISAEGRRKLAAAGIAPPTPGGPSAPGGPLAAGGLLALGPTRRAVACPQCGSEDTEELSRFGSTACKSLWRCRSCREPFDRIKEI
ncbi:ring-1,2-phenylacetyl-CoA epoxidase subunit PaaD [Kitasatospora sp. SolWspMP-SS2h]|uniref:1,2-phenylacetyl-CoA epoxidase subunit PaaD n=1 Tax=Kitasatospora sp. SolWspMP-SS2h TaxID=1305729 RepID=UPI000DB970C1|nr:1,2-phenylacetyl-CoA epoxidase subunit PaaD [Kitasatospora sp. SolWspMP-SS2h]RAJ41696.1 ring-1,2-phenylacetyl-CoA epoxidase subunit PaaD [Kitasatospora sp. SolWspMP-SS2h]